MPEPSVNDKLLAGATQFTGRLQILLGRYAKAILTGAVPNASQASKNLAARIQSDPGGMAGKIAVSLVSDPGVSGSYVPGPPEDSSKTDAQLDAVIQAVWNAGAWDNIL